MFDIYGLLNFKVKIHFYKTQSYLTFYGSMNEHFNVFCMSIIV